MSTRSVSFVTEFFGMRSWILAWVCSLTPVVDRLARGLGVALEIQRSHSRAVILLREGEELGADKARLPAPKGGSAVNQDRFIFAVAGEGLPELA